MSETFHHTFSLELPSTDDAIHETIKWSIGNSRYEIHIPILTSYETTDILPHCLLVKSKVEAVVYTAAHLGQSLYRVFPRTLSPALRSVWPSLITADPNDNQDDVNTFQLD